VVPGWRKEVIASVDEKKQASKNVPKGGGGSALGRRPLFTTKKQHKPKTRNQKKQKGYGSVEGKRSPDRAGQGQVKIIRRLYIGKKSRGLAAFSREGK